MMIIYIHKTNTFSFIYIFWYKNMTTDELMMLLSSITLVDNKVFFSFEWKCPYTELIVCLYECLLMFLTDRGHRIQIMTLYSFEDQPISSEKKTPKKTASHKESKNHLTSVSH